MDSNQKFSWYTMQFQLLTGAGIKESRARASGVKVVVVEHGQDIDKPQLMDTSVDTKAGPMK